MLMAFKSDQEPQGNSHSIPDSVRVSQSSNKEQPRDAYGIP